MVVTPRTHFTAEITYYGGSAGETVQGTMSGRGFGSVYGPFSPGCLCLR